MTPEVITASIMIVMTALNLRIGFKYAQMLHIDYKQGMYIYGDSMHSLQHIAISGILMLLSLVMCWNSVMNISLPLQFIEHMLYNVSCVFIVYPHLVSEK